VQAITPFPGTPSKWLLALCQRPTNSWLHKLHFKFQFNFDLSSTVMCLCQAALDFVFLLSEKTRDRNFVGKKLEGKERKENARRKAGKEKARKRESLKLSS
jgi:hypothetical protein